MLGRAELYLLVLNSAFSEFKILPKSVFIAMMICAVIFFPQQRLPPVPPPFFGWRLNSAFIYALIAPSYTGAQERLDPLLSLSLSLSLSHTHTHTHTHTHIGADECLDPILHSGVQACPHKNGPPRYTSSFRPHTLVAEGLIH
jgi:hypothetical protein